MDDGRPLAPTPPIRARPDRMLRDGDQVLVDALSAKVLHFWLQNRHQTLFPLVINFRSLDADQAASVVRWMAVAALATRPAPGRDGTQARALDWLAAMGADQPARQAFTAALASPPPLHDALGAVGGQALAGYAYVVALVASDPREPATQPFLDYVALRLALPLTAVRSAMRRFRP